LYGLVRALRTRLPRGRWNVKSLLANIHADALTPTEARRAGDVLAADIRRHVSRPMALILTGIGDLGAHGGAGGARIVLEKLLSRTPDHLRLVLELREVPALRVSPLLLQQRVKGIGLEDLQFTTDELGALLTRLGVAGDAAYFADLEELC